MKLYELGKCHNLQLADVLAWIGLESNEQYVTMTFHFRRSKDLR